MESDSLCGNILKRLKSTKFMLLKKGKKQIIFEPSKSLALIKVEQDDQYIASILNSIDLNFFKSLHLTDFLNFDF